MLLFHPPFAPLYFSVPEIIFKVDPLANPLIIEFRLLTYPEGHWPLSPARDNAGRKHVSEKYQTLTFRK